VQASITMLAPRSVYHIGAMRFNETRCDNPPNLTGWDLSLQATTRLVDAAPGIPQPDRLGIFHSSLQGGSPGAFPNPPTGQVGDLSL
jgi:hypothetical protein